MLVIKKQTQNTYNAARQDIDLDKQGAINDINTEIGKATSDSEYELTNAERTRQNAIAQAKAEGGKVYGLHAKAERVCSF